MDVYGLFENVDACLVLHEKGDRVFTRYYNKEIFPDLKSQKLFEKKLLSMTTKTLENHDECIEHFEDYCVVGRRAIDIHIYLIGNSFANELMLFQVLTSIHDCLETITINGQMLDRNQILINFSKALIIFDEAISDNGVVLEGSKKKLLEKMVSDRPVIQTEDEMINDLGNKTFKLFKQIF